MRYDDLRAKWWVKRARLGLGSFHSTAFGFVINIIAGTLQEIASCNGFLKGSRSRYKQGFGGWRKRKAIRK